MSYHAVMAMICQRSHTNCALLPEPLFAQWLYNHWHIAVITARYAKGLCLTGHSWGKLKPSHSKGHSWGKLKPSHSKGHSWGKLKPSHSKGHSWGKLKPSHSKGHSWGKLKPSHSKGHSWGKLKPSHSKIRRIWRTSFYIDGCVTLRTVTLRRPTFKQKKGS
jgi:hypothetical protein